MIIQTITAPTVEPVTLANMREHLRLETSGSPAAHDDDDYITLLIKAAREFAESYTRRTLITTVYDYWLGSFPAGDYLELPRPPLQSVTSVTYTDSDSSASTLTENTEFSLDSDSEPGRLVLEPDYSWPTDSLHPNNPIKIRYTAGYAGDDASPEDLRANVPQEIKHAIKLLVSDRYENRESQIIIGGPGQSVANVRAAENLLAPYRVRWSV